MMDEPTDAAVPATAPAPTRRSAQAARPAPPVPSPPADDVDASGAGLLAPKPAAAAVTAADPAPAVADTEIADRPTATLHIEPPLAWAPPAPRRPPSLGGWALAVAVIGLLLSFVVGWGFPVGIIAVITAASALRRPVRGRAVAAWALALGILSLLYSGLWIASALSRGPLF